MPHSDAGRHLSVFLCVWLLPRLRAAAWEMWCFSGAGLGMPHTPWPFSAALAAVWRRLRAWRAVAGVTIHRRCLSRPQRRPSCQLGEGTLSGSSGRGSSPGPRATEDEDKRVQCAEEGKPDWEGDKPSAPSPSTPSLEDTEALEAMDDDKQEDEQHARTQTRDKGAGSET